MLDRTRQSTLIPSGISNMGVTIVGCGAIGSHLAECLAKVGAVNLTIYDNDVVEPHNLPNQGFYLPDVGKAKVLAIKDRLETGCDANIEARNELYNGQAFFTDVVVSAVDSMAVREQMFKAWLDSPTPKIFVDGRMGARFGKVFLVNKAVPDSITDYLLSLHTDEEGLQEPCTARSTIFCAYGLAAFMCSAAISWALCELKAVELAVDFHNQTVLARTKG